jgi:hypothetical protein
VISRLEAYALARVIAGQELNGERSGLSDPVAHMFAQLEGLPPEERGAAFQAMTCARDDGPELVNLLARVDLSGPPPEDEPSDPGDNWPPLRYSNPPKAALFPMHVLPPPVADIIEHGAQAIGCPADFLALPVLVIAGGVIGRSVSLLLKDGYFAGATIFGACVGPPSDGKTPALKIVAGAVRRIDAALEAEHAQAMELWKDEANQVGSDGKKQKPSPAPKPRRIDIDDITMEALPLILADNPRGLVMVRDELTAFVLGMNQFKGGKGNDRSSALKIWSGDAIKKDRVNHENNVPIRCPHPSLSIVGGLPPDMLGELLDPKGRADGFLDRFLLAYPEPLPVADWTTRGVPEGVADAWYEVVARLWQRPLANKEGLAVPHVVRFTPPGVASWEAHYKAHVAEMNSPHFPPSMRGPWGKFREYAGRLALILALLDHAADPTTNPTGLPDVGPKIVENAWELICYFKSHSRRVQAAIARGRDIGGGPVVLAVADWVRNERRLTFTERDIKQARRWIDPVDLTNALLYLAERNAIRAREAPDPRPRGGRPPSPAYEVNPALLVTQNPQNTQYLDPAGPEAGF